MKIVFPQTNSTDPGDRLGFAMVLALAVHALIIFGVGFQLDKTPRTAPTLDVTLALHRSREAPDKADYLAQTLTDLRDGTRDNAPPMAAIVRGWSDEDIAAMSRYLGGL